MKNGTTSLLALIWSVMASVCHILLGGIIINANSIGNYCGANVGVVIGNNHKWDERPTIGDHVGFLSEARHTAISISAIMLP